MANSEPSKTITNVTTIARILHSRVRNLLSRGEWQTDDSLVAGMFAEVYRNIYPNMSASSRNMLKDFILNDWDIEKELDRRQAANSVARQIVHSHNSGKLSSLEREQYIRDTHAEELAPDIVKIRQALATDSLNSSQEIELLTQQILSIPNIRELMTTREELADGFDRWVNEAAKVGSEITR